MKLYDQYKRTFEDYISSKVFEEMNDQVGVIIVSLLNMAGAAAPQKDITFDECWSILQEEAINKMVNIFEAEEQPNDKIFDSEEYMRFYTPDNWNQKLYDQYKKTFEDYISSKVYREIHEQVHDITMSMIDRERNGEQIDQAMVSEVIKICEEMGSGNASKHDANNIDEALVLLGEATYSFTGLSEYLSLQIRLPFSAVSELSMAGGAAALKYPMNFEEAWPILEEEAINKFIDKLELEEHLPSHQYINSEEYMRFYTLVYNVCSPNPIGPEVLQLYEQYKRIFEDYVSSKVYWEVNVQVSEIIISLRQKYAQIDKERKGEEIDQALVKEVLNIYDEIESGDASKHHAKYIEDAIIEATSKFYSRKAVNWIAMESYDDYMLKIHILKQHDHKMRLFTCKYQIVVH
ncbi:hypothetical protein MIMGU_mgv11b018794mg [Erythranthe guttata]|uniref:Cullin N-terminal domain-containing protein n=1 Tax=Erythranthe guttata TaxID=4155 RepID=A0A022RYA1_ERYGU|nr:hypothetical protein MIMGU_mgv11b018794mg [Erythranthe guttata]